MSILSQKIKGGTNLTKSKAYKPAQGLTPTDILSGKTDLKNKSKIYVAAFFIPVILTLIAYAAFGIYPFGERSVLALDLNGQYIYYFEHIRDAFWGDGSIFYSWERNLSGEFMGIIGYYLASPFTLIVMLLPRTMILESLLIMQLCKLGTAGLTFCLYAQKSKNVKPLQSVLFSTMYAMMGYAVIQLIDPMWIDGVVFLPLIILGLEYLIDDGRKINYIIPLAIMFIANFYIGYMIAFFVAIYFVYYLFFGTKRKFKNTSEYAKTIGTMILATIVVLMCSAIMLLPVYNGLSLGKFEFSGKPDYSFATQFNPIELVPTLLPNQYYSVNMQGLPEIYCGVLSFVLIPLFYMNSKIKLNKKIGYSLVTFILLFSMYIKPVDMMWHGGQTPNWLPYRYSFLVAFTLVSMACEIFSQLDGYKLSIKSVAGTFTGIAIAVFMFEAKMASFNYSSEKYKYVAITPYTTKENISGETRTELWLGTLVFGLILAAFYLLMVYFYSNADNKKKRNVISCIMAFVVFFEAGYNAYDSFKKINKEVAYSNRDTYYNEIQGGRDVTKALEEYDSGLYRSEKTFSRCVNDNLAYGLKGVSHSSSVMNTKIINFLETMGYSMRSYVTSYDGNTPVADSLLGIKYVVNEPKKTRPLLNPAYKYVFTQDYVNNQNKNSTLDVYENPNALSIGYMVSDEIKNLAFLGNDNPFNSQNMFLSTITGNTDFTVTPNTITIDGNREYYTRLPYSYALNQCSESPYGNQKLFTADADAIDPTINIHFTAESTDQIYMYLKTQNEKAVNTWISSEKNENNEFINHQSLGTGAYYENHDYSIIRVGSFEPGTEIEVRLTIRLNHANPDHEEYTIIKDFFFYHLNYNLFEQDIAQLKNNQWNITEYNDRFIKGTITAEEGQIMLTTIPTEPGWTVKVDGKKVDTLEVLKAFIGIELEPGEHTITMKYTPPGFAVGVFTLILGIGTIIMLYMYDKKNNKILIQKARAKERAAKGLPPEESQKPVSEVINLIKSNGAVANIEFSEAEQKVKEASENKQQKKNNQTKNNKSGKNKKKK